MKNQYRGQRGGFTLVELLVVITIITILAGLATVGIGAAIRAAREGAIAFEIANMETALEAYYTQYGAYPPAVVDTTTNAGKDALLKHVRKLFRNSTETRSTLPSMQLDPSEALVYFLGGDTGVGKSLKNNVTRPISGAGDPIAIMDFNQTQLLDGDGDGYKSYLPRFGEEVPYVYFESSSYGSAAYTVSGQGVARPYALTSGGWAEPSKFQIISGGLDGHYGAYNPGSPATKWKQFPGGLFYELEDRDNITNFSEGPLRKSIP